jgi:hypothetical protein
MSNNNGVLPSMPKGNGQNNNKQNNNKQHREPEKPVTMTQVDMTSLIYGFKKLIYIHSEAVNKLIDEITPIKKKKPTKEQIKEVFNKIKDLSSEYVTAVNKKHEEAIRDIDIFGVGGRRKTRRARKHKRRGTRRHH